jgi:hypothetical protein
LKPQSETSEESWYSVTTESGDAITLVADHTTSRLSIGLHEFSGDDQELTTAVTDLTRHDLYNLRDLVLTALGHK